MKSRVAFYIFLGVVLAFFGYPRGYYVLHDAPANGSSIQKDSRQNPTGIGCYVINLDRSQERWTYVKDRIAELGFPVQRIAGVDGRALSDDEITHTADVATFRQNIGSEPKRGEIGCYLSHLKAWQKFLASNFEYALFFEDDITFAKDELLTVIKELLNTPSAWDVVNFEIRHSGMPLRLERLPSGHELSIYLAPTKGAGCYLINRQAGHAYLSKALPIKLQVDKFMIRAWEFNLASKPLVYCGIENPRVVHQTFGDSNIDTSQTIVQPKSPLHFLFRKMYQFQTEAMRIVYNLKLYLKHHVLDR